MKQKVLIILIAAFVFLLLFSFRNITYAFISANGKIDAHTMNTMVRGVISPVKEFQLKRNVLEIQIALPKHAAALEKDIYLVPMHDYTQYLKSMIEEHNYSVEALGSTIFVRTNEGNAFYINTMPCTSAYMRLQYTFAMRR